MERGIVEGLMRDLLETRVVRILETCGDTGDRTDTNTYVVGGFVRDLLLKKANLDIDIVVEGDGVKYSKDLASRLRGELKTYDEFGTATVISRKGVRIDVASARRETYREPAELPVVTVGNMKDDMFRRDFTMNSMAISLNSRSFGKLVDLFGGERDISRSTVRILHDLSFMDDPTRILRAIRFETRLGFRMDAKTERLLSEALSSGVLERLTPERRRYELELLLGEKNPAQSMDRMKRLNILRHLGPGLKCPDKKHLERISISIGEFGKRLRAKNWLVYLIAIADSLPFSEAVEFGKSVYLRKKELKKLIQVKMAKPEVKALETDESIRRSAIHRVLRDLSPEALVYLYSLQKKQLPQERFRQYIRKDRGRRTLMTGDDLKRLGVTEGPVYREVLDRVLDARIDGEVESLEDELRLAKEMVEVS